MYQILKKGINAFKFPIPPIWSLAIDIYFVTFPLKKKMAEQTDMVPIFTDHGVQRKKKTTNCDVLWREES